MFTGLVETTTRVRTFRETPAGRRLVLEPPEFFSEIGEGESIAVNGCCLTALPEEGALAFDLLKETVFKTSFEFLAQGRRVNLERALRAGDRLGGHFVQGHVDGTARVLESNLRGGDLFLKIELAGEFANYVISKGSIAVNGVSLTVAELFEDAFAVWIIPHTREVTNLGELEVGDLVNLEFDMLAKQVVRVLENSLSNRKH